MTLRGSEDDGKALRRLIKGYGERTASKAIWRAIRDAPGYVKRIDELTSEVAQLHRVLADLVDTRILVMEAEREQKQAIDRAHLLYVEATLSGAVRHGADPRRNFASPGREIGREAPTR